MNKHERTVLALLAQYVPTHSLVRAKRELAAIAPAARDAALEEAVRACAARAKTWAKKVDEAHAKDRDDLAMEAGASACALHDQARDIRALKSQPARRYLDAEEVREALHTHLRADTAAVIARALDLDAAPPLRENGCHSWCTVRGPHEACVSAVLSDDDSPEREP